MPTHTGRLLLSTHDPLLLPAKTLLTATLAEAGFLGTPLWDRDDAFALGERFLQLVTFAGCSVRIELSPNGEAPFCHIRLTGPFERPKFLIGRNTRPPRCCNCRAPLQNWEKLLADGNAGPAAPIACTACREATPPWNYDWKVKAGFGRLFIQIEEVFPGEAAPTPGLMNLLEGCTGCMWRYFYIQDP
jgi:hypothetical protein